MGFGVSDANPRGNARTGSPQALEDKTEKRTFTTLNSLTLLLRVFLSGLLGTHQDVPKPNLRRLPDSLKPLMAKATIFTHISKTIARRVKRQT
ncbi:hypothetical protein MCERH10_01526 [Caulobacteraceae bacterium]|jgi:hypothetical protein